MEVILRPMNLSRDIQMEFLMIHAYNMKPAHMTVTRVNAVEEIGLVQLTT